MRLVLEPRLLGHDDIRVPPLHIWTPPRVSSAGGEVADFMRMFGRPPDPEQQLALDCLLSQRAGGIWSASTIGMVEARQNGKTASVLLPSAMYDLWLRKCPLVLWTAHLQSTADKTFADVQGLIAGYEGLSRRVRSIASGNGNHTITLVGGQQMVFMARTAKAGRGFAEVESITADEALYLTVQQQSALIPTQSTAKNPQFRMAGSAGFMGSTVWRELRDRGRRGSTNPVKGDPGLAYIEWGAERLPCARRDCRHGKEMVGCRLDDRALWQQANHTMRSDLVPDGRISEAFIATERQDLPPAQFALEIMSWWEESAADNPVTGDMWARLVDRGSVLARRSPRILTVDVSPGMKSAAIVATGRREDGRPHVEVVKYGVGVDWAVADLVRLRKAHRAKIVVLRNSPAAALIGDLIAAKADPYLMSELEYLAACGLFETLTDPTRPMESLLAHLGDPLLATALAGAKKKDVGDGTWKWSRAASDDICTLVAATMGPWALANMPAPKNVFAAKA